MSASALRAPKSAIHHGRAGLGRYESSVAISLSESSSSLVAWKLRVDVETTGGRARLGTIITAAPSGLRPGSRVVALASFAGAIGWDVTATPLAPYPPNVGGWLRVESCEETGEFGLMPCDGSLAVAGDANAGAYNHDADVIAGATVIPAGARVRGWSLIASGGGAATLAITSPVFGALPPITVPTSAAFGDTPDNLIGPATFTFAGFILSRWVSWRELA